MPDISIDKAELVAVFVETLLYGIYVSLFHQAIFILIRKHPVRIINWRLVVASVGIFITATGHCVFVFLRALGAFIDHRDKPGGPIAYYENLRDALEVCQASFFVVVTFFGDSMAVYRVFVVYNRRLFPILLPLTLLCATLVTSIASVIIIGESSTPQSAIFYPKLKKWMPAFFGLSVSTSMVSSLLIAARLWYINSYVTAYSDRVIQLNAPNIVAVRKILVESAAMYSTMMLIYLATYLGKTNYSIVFGAMVAPIVGIAFSLITIRVKDALYRYPTDMGPIGTSTAGIRYSVSQTDTPLPRSLSLDIRRQVETCAAPHDDAQEKYKI